MDAGLVASRSGGADFAPSTYQKDRLSPNGKVYKRVIANRTVSRGELVYISSLEGGLTILPTTETLTTSAFWIGVATEAVFANRGVHGRRNVVGDQIDVQVSGEAVMSWPSSLSAVKATDSNTYIRFYLDNYSVVSNPGGRGVVAWTGDRPATATRSYNVVLFGERHVTGSI